MRKIKSSRRGLTFTAPSLRIGSHYRYIVDLSEKKIYIIPDDEGKMTVSRKKCGKEIKPLIDIRSEEVRELVKSADYMELKVLANGNILVKIRKKIQKTASSMVSLQEILQSRTKEFIIPAKMLAVSGGNAPLYQFGHATLAEDSYFSYLENTAPTYFKKGKGKSELQKVYSAISLFSGAGMLDKAFLDGGRFQFVYGVDFDQAAVNTYRENIGDHIECRDIRTVQPEDIPNADIAIGGPCCQAYSNANRHNIDTAEGEAKRLLIDDYARLVKAKNVKVWVVENVPELLTKSQGFYLNRLCDALSDYEVTATIVNDDEVGGYSRRKRAIVIGSKIGRIELPQIHEVTSGTVREALSKVDATWFNFEDVTIPKPETQKKMSFVPEGGNWKDIPKPYNNYGPDTHSCIMRRLKWDEPSITLCNFRKSNILHPSENRILSVAEAAAIMGLDKTFRFLGTLSEKQQMVANGVTQAIGKLVKDTVLKALDRSNICTMPA